MILVTSLATAIDSLFYQEDRQVLNLAKTQRTSQRHLKGMKEEQNKRNSGRLEAMIRFVIVNPHLTRPLRAYWRSWGGCVGIIVSVVHELQHIFSPRNVRAA